MMSSSQVVESFVGKPGLEKAKKRDNMGMTRVRVKRTIHSATLQVHTQLADKAAAAAAVGTTAKNSLQVVTGSMVGHLRKNQRISIKLEFDTTKFNGRQVSIRSRLQGFRMRNNTTRVCGSQAVLDDVRFLDSTHRSAKMDLLIEVDMTDNDDAMSNECVQFVMPKAIKITADGPRNRASKSKKNKSKNDCSMILDSPPITPAQTSSHDVMRSSSSSSCSSLSSEPSSPSSISSDYLPGSVSPSPSQSSTSMTTASDDDDDNDSVLQSKQHHGDHPLFNVQEFAAYYNQILLREFEFNQNVQAFEHILNEDNKQRGEQQWPQHVIDQIVQLFASLLRQQY